MKKLRHILLLAIASLLWSSAVFGEKLKYEVLLFGKKIGETTVEVKDSAGGTRQTPQQYTGQNAIHG